MKKIITIMFYAFFLTSIPFFVRAVVPCPDNTIPELGMTDPACYTVYTVSDGYWKDCTWYFGRNDYECGPYHHSSKSDCSDDSYCVSKGKCWFHGAVYYNRCGGIGEWCDNMGPLPDKGRQWVDTSYNKYTCYFTTVSEWYECDKSSGWQLASDVTTIADPQCKRTNEATGRSCPVCGVADGQPTGTPPLTGDLCAFGSPASTDPQLVGNLWKWTCTDNTTVNCEAPNEAPGICSSDYNGVALEALPADKNLLCSSGTINIASITDLGDDGWSWTCDKIGNNPAHNNMNCNAPCFDYSLNIDKEQFYWSEDDNVTVTVNVEKVGACRDRYSCTVKIDGDEGDTGTGTHTHTIDARTGESSYDVSAICKYRDIDGNEDPDKDVTNDPDNINGNCIARSCTPQGTCQGTPQSASSHNTCQSTCSSNADCSKGRMIETRP